VYSISNEFGQVSVKRKRRALLGESSERDVGLDVITEIAKSSNDGLLERRCWRDELVRRSFGFE
jgi:hypothetical protein